MNIASGLSGEELRFIEEFAGLLAPWGMPTTSGRIYAYVILSPAPVGVDQIAADLGMSKGGAWNAAKLLERFGHVRRYGQPGSKRALYGPSENFAAVLTAQSALLGDIGKLLGQCAATVAPAESVGRLQLMSDFYLSMRGRIDAAIREWTAKRAGVRSKA